MVKLHKTMGCESSELAECVLHMFKFVCTDEELKRCSYDVYSNGRENGYYIEANSKRVAFSEFRRSDDIVVYYSPVAFWDKDGLTDDIYYNHRKMFRYHEVFEATRFIRMYLLTKDTK